MAKGKRTQVAVAKCSVIRFPRLSPATIREMFNNACVAAETGDNTTALKLYQDIIWHCPKHATAMVNLGSVYTSRRSLEEAVTWFRKAIEVDKNYALAFLHLGTVLDDLGYHVESITALERSLELEECADAHYNLAFVYESLGDKCQALLHWKRYIELDPCGVWHDKAKENFKKAVAQCPLRLVAASKFA